MVALHSRVSLFLVALTLMPLAACGRKNSPVIDSSPPDPVVDLRVAKEARGVVTLTWTATGDDGTTGRAAATDVRYALDSLTVAGWGAATPWSHPLPPAAAGAPETLAVTGLNPAVRLYFAVKVADEVPNWSRLSNVVSARPMPDTLPPAEVTDLAAGDARLARVTLRWTAPGDDGRGGRAARYEVRHATTPITESRWAAALPAASPPLPLSSGQAQTMTVTDLLPNSVHYFGLKTFDEAGNSSLLSNGTSLRTLDPLAVGHMVRIPAGSFTMGSPETELGRDDYEIQHAVTLTRPFYLSQYEVTQNEWAALMRWNVSFFPDDPSFPVESITWFDAVSYCNRLSAREGLRAAYLLTPRKVVGVHITEGAVARSDSANGFRLPTEAEWEYACRAGTHTAFYDGDISAALCSPPDTNLTRVGWYCGNSSTGFGPNPLAPRNPGLLAANSFHLYDMHGNVGEWCWDHYGNYPPGPARDPAGPDTGQDCAVRGGAWEYYAQHCRSAARTKIPPGAVANVLGLRVARSLP